jgi:hypothetical protein
MAQELFATTLAGQMEAANVALYQVRGLKHRE